MSMQRLLTIAWSFTGYYLGTHLAYYECYAAFTSISNSRPSTSSTVYFCFDSVCRTETISSLNTRVRSRIHFTGTSTTSSSTSSLSASSASSSSSSESQENDNKKLKDGMSPPSSSSPSSPAYPRAAVSCAVRLQQQGENEEDQAYYLMVQRGQVPNKGRWSLPGGKLEMGETTLEGGKRELEEETKFEQQCQLIWHPRPITTADSILHLKHVDDEESSGKGNQPTTSSVAYHFVIAICFAKLPIKLKDTAIDLPTVQAADDAADARWWSLDDIRRFDESMMTPGLLSHLEYAEHLYLAGIL